MTTLNEQALPISLASELRTLIVRGTLSPGEHLGQIELSERFGHSKVPIREALKHLLAEGFLLHDRNRGYFVAPLKYDEAAQLYKMRRWIEADLLRTARWPSKAEIAEFRRQFDELEALNQDSQFEEWSRRLQALRLSIFSLSPQKLMLREAERLWNLTDRYRSFLPRHTDKSPARALLVGLERQDREMLLESHKTIRDNVEAMLQEALGN